MLRSCVGEGGEHGTEGGEECGEESELGVGGEVTYIHFRPRRRTTLWRCVLWDVSGWRGGVITKDLEGQESVHSVYGQSFGTEIRLCGRVGQAGMV